VIKVETGICREKAILVLQNMSLDIDNKKLFAHPQFCLIRTLLNVIRTDCSLPREKSLAVLWNISGNLDNQKLLGSPEFDTINTIIPIIREVDGEPRRYALAVLWRMSECEDNAVTIMRTGIFADVISFIKENSTYPDVKDGGGNSIEFHSIMAIYAISEHEDSRSQLRALDTSDVLGPMMQYDTAYGLYASLCFVFLFGREESGPHAEQFRAGLMVLKRIIDLLENVIEARGGEGYKNGVFTLFPVTLAISELCLSDTHKKQLAISGVRDLLVRIISDVKEPKLYNNLKKGHEYRVRCAAVASRALLQLSFVTEDNDTLTSEEGFMSASSNIRNTLIEYVAIIRSDGGGPAELLIKRLTRRAFRARLPRSYLRDRQHIMISYSWDKSAHPKLVESLSHTLRGLGYEVWRDVEGSALVPTMSSGAADERMAEAIEASRFVIICVSREYKVSSNCRMEANYASIREKTGNLKLLYVMVQEDYTPVSLPNLVDGYLGKMVESSLWYPMWNDDQVSLTAHSLAEIIGSRCKSFEGQTSSLSTLTTTSTSSNGRFRYDWDVDLSKYILHYH
jgi:hypothetical protein